MCCSTMIKCSTHGLIVHIYLTNEKRKTCRKLDINVSQKMQLVYDLYTTVNMYE